MPIWHIGKRREALAGNSEVYKKTIVRYLEKRGYYIKVSSDVEATFPDCVLTRKAELKEYWLEAKATTVSLGESAFLSQLGKYLAEYLIRTPANRFRMMLACYNIKNPTFFGQIFEKFDSEALTQIVSKIVEASELKVAGIIGEANPEDIKKFFEDAIVVVANPFELQMAEEKIAPSVPTTPTLSDAEYASMVLNRFGNIEPLETSDFIRLNLFRLRIPKKLFISESPYPRPKSMFDEMPNVPFPAFHLEKGKLFSFCEMTKDTLLGKFADLNSVTTVDVGEFDKDENNRRIVIRILNNWIKNKCRRFGLQFDKRTQSYFFPKKVEDDSPITVIWRPKSRRSRRELTKPMLTNDEINFWVHRAAEIFARKFWGEYYIQIRPRWIFSLDGKNLLEGTKVDRLDRAFRKSIYNRNLNQLYDALFWYRYIFSETNVFGDRRLDEIPRAKGKQLVRVLEQVRVESSRKPNVEVEEEVERFDKIEDQLVTFFEKSLDDFM